MASAAPGLSVAPTAPRALREITETGRRIDRAAVEPGNCSALDKLRMVNATVGSATGVTRGGLYFCRVAGVARPTADSYINFEIWLPPPSKWNGKIYASSGGSALGGILEAQLEKGVSRGYAAVSNDRGHSGRDDRGAPFAGDGTWAPGHPEKILDWSYRGEHYTAIAARSIIAAYYGRTPEHAYYESCSAGGQQALMEAERYPSDYDGVIAAAPAIRMNYSMANVLWQMIPGRLSEASKLSDDKLAMLHAAALKACDKADGLSDGLISRPLACTFDPAIVECRGGDAATCLTPAQLDTARRYYSGMRRRDGSTVAAGYGAPVGSELEWSTNINSTRPTMIFHFFKYWVYEKADYDVTTFNFDSDFDAMLRKKVAGRTLADALDTTANLNAFQATGGKLIMWTGGADILAPPGTDALYRDAVARNLTGANVDDVLRVFLVPGVGHCGGGDGLDRFDMLQSLEAWVEDGRAPDRILASRRRDDGSTSREMPLCPYPQYPHYLGSGDPRKEESFACAK